MTNNFLGNCFGLQIVREVPIICGGQDFRLERQPEPGL